jgi:hypothetical protein
MAVAVEMLNATEYKVGTTLDGQMSARGNLGSEFWEGSRAGLGTTPMPQGSGRAVTCKTCTV